MGEVVSIAYPLILSQMSLTLQVFVDRLFLTWYSTEAVAAAVTALLVTWSVVGLCINTGEYVTTSSEVSCPPRTAWSGCSPAAGWTFQRRGEGSHPPGRHRPNLE